MKKIVSPKLLHNTEMTTLRNKNRSRIVAKKFRLLSKIYSKTRGDKIRCDELGIYPRRQKRG